MSVHPEDARLCLKYGVDGIMVSNHGGRAEETGRGTIDVLPEIILATGGRIPVLIDSGFRRGADVVKALAMGAPALGDLDVHPPAAPGIARPAQAVTAP